MKKMNKLVFASLLTVLAMACSEAGGGGGTSDGSGASSGQGGSMARFTINGDYMYTVDSNTLKMFDLSQPDQPAYLGRKDQNLGFGIETIFCKDTLLFIGSQDGMYIYNVARPEFPSQLSSVSHIRSCDPVVASGKYAYVTLNSQNTWCGNTSNVLNIYDISNPRNPVWEKTEALNYPKGLGIDGNKLFVCDDILGIKVFDVSNPLNPIWRDDLSHLPEANGMTPYDVIPVGGLLLTSTDMGLYQFDYTGERLQFVSKLLTVEK
ncbi:hypothetical protein SAMD00024442_11_20 [Candidatus Symbiothrix dinenymphae]|nr:hypothetical protein SAMD00024442_11_20 [Candidatus Symbiothrix dinenymphae]